MQIIAPPQNSADYQQHASTGEQPIASAHGHAHLLQYALICAAAFLLPPISGFLGCTLPLAHIHDFAFGCALAIITALSCRRASAREQIWRNLLLAGGAAFYLQLVDLTSNQVFATDYMQVVVAAMSFVLHGSPYFLNTDYVLYPPLYAQIIAALFNLCTALVSWTGVHCTQQQIWDAVQYLFQNAILAATVGLIALTYKFCRSISGWRPLPAMSLSLSLTLPSSAVFWTLRKYQSNIFVTDLVLAAILLVDRFPIAAALCAAIGAHLKVYPGLLAVAWLCAKRWKACSWTLVFFSILVIGETVFCGRPQIWPEYMTTASRYVSTLPTVVPGWLLGSPNLLNETYQSLRIFHFEGFTLSQIAQFVHLEQLALCAWFAWRFLTAQRLQVPATVGLTHESAVIIDRTCDLLSLMLLIGPSVLADHYVLAIPIALWTIVSAFRRRPVFTVAGMILILSWSFKSLLPLPLQPFGLILLALARSSQRAHSVDHDHRTA